MMCFQQYEIIMMLRSTVARLFWIQFSFTLTDEYLSKLFCKFLNRHLAKRIRKHFVSTQKIFYEINLNKGWFSKKKKMVEGDQHNIAKNQTQVSSILPKVLCLFRIICSDVWGWFNKIVLIDSTMRLVESIMSCFSACVRNSNSKKQ